MRQFLLLVAIAILAGLSLKHFVAPRPPSAQDLIQQWMDETRAEGGSFWEDPVRDECGDPCVVANNNGGHSVVFKFAAAILPSRRKHGAVIDGFCNSACALFADLARPNVCVTRTALMGFHRSNQENSPEHADDINAWVVTNGGFPSNVSGQLNIMRWPDTLNFWPECKNWRN